jgi:hypothetical protein
LAGGNTRPSNESSPLGKPGSTAIPVQFRAAEFTALILPPLSRPKRGPQCQIGYHQAFNSLLKVLSPGMPWQEWPIDKDPEGKAELPYPGVFKLCARWAKEGSRERAFRASVNYLDEAQQLDRSLLPGDGSNPVAKKGARALAPVATNPRTASKGSP